MATPRRTPNPTASIPDDAQRAAHLAELLRALAHGIRLRIVAILCDGPESVNALAERLDAPPAIVSQQLRVLRLNRLVNFEKREGKTFYRLQEPQLRVLVGCLEKCRIP